MTKWNDDFDAEDPREMTEAEEREQRDRYEELKADVRRDEGETMAYTLDAYIAENVRKTAEIKELEAEVRRLQGELAAAKRGGKSRRW